MFHLEAKYAGTKQLLDKKKTKQIIFRHSHIAITDYTLGDNWEFEKLLSVWDKMTFKYILMGGYYVKSLREFRVNRGFNVYILRQHFPGYPMVVENCAYDSKPAKIELYTAPRSDFQKVAISFMLSKGEFTNNEKFTQCMITANVGTGKTFCGTAITALRKARALVIVPLAKLLPQWAESYINFTSVKEDEILMIQGGKVCEEILEGKHKDKKVFIAMIDTIAAFNKRYGDIQTMDLLSATRAEIKIVDEIHLDMKAISMLEAMSNFKYNYYMSATPGRSDGKENWLFKQLFYHVPKFGSNFTTQEEKHLNIMVKRYYFTPTPRQINRMVNRKVGINTKLYERELALSPPEVKQSFKDSLILMLNWANKQVKKGNKIMVLGQSIDFLKYIYSIVQEVIPEEDCGLYYGGMKKEEKEESLQKKVIVATTSTLGTGADIKGLQFVINAATYSSWVMVTQVSGRLRKLPDDTPTVYIELVNFGYIKTINQFESRKPHLLKVSKTNKIIIVD